MNNSATTKIYVDDLELVNSIKKKIGIKSNPVVLKLALAEFVKSKTYARIALGLQKELK